MKLHENAEETPIKIVVDGISILVHYPEISLPEVGEDVWDYEEEAHAVCRQYLRHHFAGMHFQSDELKNVILFNWDDVIEGELCDAFEFGADTEEEARQKQEDNEDAIEFAKREYLRTGFEWNDADALRNDARIVQTFCESGIFCDEWDELSRAIVRACVRAGIDMVIHEEEDD